MRELIRLVYASRAAFKPAPFQQGVEPSVARILMQSRRNNAHANIGGVLYFGDGYFFQVLEGGRELVNQTYQRIAADPRHSDVTVLSLKTVPERLFANWSMKYVPAEEDVRAFLQARNDQRFEPLKFREEEAEALIDLFQQNGDAGGKKGDTVGVKANSKRTGWSWWRRMFSWRA